MILQIMSNIINEKLSLIIFSITFTCSCSSFIIFVPYIPVISILYHKHRYIKNKTRESSNSSLHHYKVTNIIR